MIAAEYRNTQHFNDYLKAMALPKESLFTTDIDLWPIYMDGFEDPEDRQYHNCHACRKFIQDFGNWIANIRRMVFGEHAIGKGLGCSVRVHTSVITQYEIDRWD